MLREIRTGTAWRLIETSHLSDEEVALITERLRGFFAKKPEWAPPRHPGPPRPSAADARREFSEVRCGAVASVLVCAH